MEIIIVLLQISLISCSFSNEMNKIKLILNNYKESMQCNRYKRCLVQNKKVDAFAHRAVNFLDKTQKFKDVIESMDASECIKSDNVNLNYTKRHILDSLLLDTNVSNSHWKEYKSVYNKEYRSPHHEMSALSKWRENLRRVVEHNRKYLTGEISYSLHLNYFGDLGVADYFKKILKLFDTVPLFDPAEDHHKTAYRNVAHRKTPKKVDWRSKGFKPRLEEQFKCGACYAFAVAHALQAQLYKRHGNWSELSPQQIVDCSLIDGNMGCDGGSLRAAFRYAARKGLLMENYYPYTGKKGQCRIPSHIRRVRPRRWAMIPAGDEEGMERALATIGPLAVGINASPFTFQLYRSGIYDDPFCFPWRLNHAMLLVGYTEDYWILLNWWGKNWGEDGYMRIRRGYNRCGVSNMAAYVEL
ncbi:procathepsin L-like isoform X1 [Amyelois transitella]|uniref:procathepsin L-like isoform X1 n=1 Tax=Amyelois transitella TaxID=680683 RepID=UPI0029904533|nr:procathepsin L-like isoform X1 [Amyelois transitella]